MRRTIISPGTDGDRAARVRLTTGQARTRVLGMTFRPGPSPLGGPRPSSTKDGGERGQHLEKTLARTRGKGTTPGFEGQAGSYIMAQKGTVKAVTSGSHFGQSLRGSHFGAVTSRSHFTLVASLRRPLPVCQCSLQPLPLSGRRHSPRRHNVSVTEVCSILPCHPPPPVIRPADHALPVLKFRSKSKLQVRVEDGIYHLVPSVQAGTRDHR